MAKRLLDLALAALALVATAPLVALAAVGIRLSSPGPVLYRAERVGRDQRPFIMFKLRTMHLRRRSDSSRITSADDPRVFPLGAWLRAVKVDELPQLWNVLRGEMSLVGPRPLPQRDFERLEDWHKKRYLVMPGITGLWQVSGRAELDFDDLVRLDFHYLERWSVFLDLTILLKTVPAVLTRRGAF